MHAQKTGCCVLKDNSGLHLRTRTHLRCKPGHASKQGGCYSSLTPSWYLSLFFLALNSFALWYVLLRLDTYFTSLKFSELLFCRTLTRAVPFPLLPDGLIPVDSFLLMLILDSLLFRPILSYRTRISHYSSILTCSMKFYAYASSSISRQLPVPLVLILVLRNLAYS